MLKRTHLNIKYNSPFKLETYYHNKQYEIVSREGESRMLIVAPHGGRIEPGTAQIADAIAGDTHSFYSLYTFYSTRKQNDIDDIFHITSDYYYEPHLSNMISHSLGVITIHGCRESQEVVFIGGRNFRLKNIISCVLNEVNIMVDDQERFSALSKNNICNRCITGEGIQLELSEVFRQSLFEDNIFFSNKLERTAKFPDLIPNNRFFVFVRGIQKAINIFFRQLD